MFYLLCSILILNLFLAYRQFRNIIAPPVLMGAGMLLACLIVYEYYELWDLNDLSFETVLCLGGGTLSFTFTCLLLDNRSSSVIVSQMQNREDINCNYYLYETSDHLISNVNKLVLLYLLSIVVGVVGLLLRYRYLTSTYGSFAMGELALMSREDKLFEVPSHIRMMQSFSLVISTFSIWFLFTMLYLKNIKKVLLLLFICQIIVTALFGVMESNKGTIFGIISKIYVIFIIFYYSNNNSFHINKKIYFRLAVMFILLLLSFKSLSELVGRQIKEQSNTDLVAEYCGAEIKNFDIYINSYSGNKRSKYFGAVTFGKLYSEFGSKKGMPDSEGFQRIRGITLGNVYTTFYSFHKDFGIIGCIIAPVIMAIVIMFIYKKALRSLLDPYKFNFYLFLYGHLAISLFMSFFSCKITESNFNLGFFRNLLYILIVAWFLKKYIGIQDIKETII